MTDVPLAPTPEGVDEEAWAAACAAVRAYCGWHVAPSITDTYTLDGSGSQFQALPSMHVTDIVLVTELGTDLDASGYEWSEMGQLWREAGWAGHFRGLIVEMTHGYDSCPPEILGVLQEAASRGVGGSAVSQVGQVRMGGVSGVPGAASFMLDQKAVLDRYAIPGRP